MVSVITTSLLALFLDERCELGHAIDWMGQQHYTDGCDRRDDSTTSRPSMRKEHVQTSDEYQDATDVSAGT
jgi:hypothetical protein